MLLKTVFIVVLLINFNYGLSVNKRIINGSDLESVNRFAVQVLPFLDLTTQAWGGGTLIAQNVVLTQAQLVHGSTRIIVRFGSLDWGLMVDMQIADTAINPLYNPETYVNDIALLRLPGSVEQSKSLTINLEDYPIK